MIAISLGQFIFFMSLQLSCAQNPASTGATSAEREMIELSKEKWELASLSFTKLLSQ